MTMSTAAVLEPVGQGQVVLESVDIRACLRGLYSEVLVTQSYRNVEEDSIEAVYTFPLPLDAVLLDLSLELNGQTLHGLVQARAEAEERYEEAIEDGDTAILLEEVQDGLYTVNVGNLLPGERAVVRFRYAQLHRWQGDSLRFHLPTTLAPRYGDPAAAGLGPHQLPQHVLTASRGFSLTLQIEGELAGGDFECPSHPLAVERRDGLLELALAGGSTLMDRDFILVLRAPEGGTAEGLWAPDGEEHVALASFHPMPPVEDTSAAAPRCLKLVVDCSGSMGGDAIAQARSALHEILSQLRPADHFEIIAFGSTWRALFGEPKVASRANIRRAARFVERMDADMGGTEIHEALRAAFRAGEVEGLPSDVLLITDGGVWQQDDVIQTVRHSGHRLFTVGVGSAVSEVFLRRLAGATQGACELVSPREDMAERIVRHFHRLHQPRAHAVRIEWPAAPLRQTPGSVEGVFAGDTLHVFGWFPERPEGRVRLVMELEDGSHITQELALSEGEAAGERLSSLPRVAAHARLDGLEAEAARELATDYRLVTRQTSCILVAEREEGEKLRTVPALRKVPQVLAAGWGGMGSTTGRLPVVLSSGLRIPPGDLQPFPRLDGLSYWHCDNAPEEPQRALPDGGRERFVGLISALNDRYPDRAPARLDIMTIRELDELGLDAQTSARLSKLVAEGYAERDVVWMFLVLLGALRHKGAFSRHVLRVIGMAFSRLKAGKDLEPRIRQIIGG